MKIFKINEYITTRGVIICKGRNSANNGIATNEKPKLVDPWIIPAKKMMHPIIV